MPERRPDAARLKWELAGPGGIGAGVAESDFGTAPAVVEALTAAVGRHELGYPAPSLVLSMLEACARWHADAYGWAISPADVRPVPDVMRALHVTIDRFSPPGAAVVVPVPAYPAFLAMPAVLDRPLLTIPARDLDALDDAFARGGHVLVLCNPHNPLGDVLTADELRATSEVVARHGGRVFADEVHGPLVYEPHRHVPYASVSPEAAAHTITATSASKAWNLPGLRCAQVVLANRADRRAWDALDRLVTDVPAPLGIIAATTAYDHGRGWLDELRARLDANRRLLAAEVGRRLPGVRHRPPEGTFLAWLDLTDVVAPGTDVAARLAAEARVLTLGGVEMGVAPECVRLNFATTEDVLADLVDRLVSVVGDRQPGAARPP